MLFATAVVSPVLAANRKVGVTLNGTAMYDASTSSGSYNRTQLTVIGIVVDEVHLNLTYYNGTTVDDYDVIVGNVSDSSVLPFFFIYLIGSGLEAGDEVSPGLDFVLNDTMTQTWAGVSRQIVHLSIYDGGIEGWWDQETGLMVKINFFFFAWLNLTLVDTDLWEPTNLLSTTNLLLAAAGIELIIIVVLAVKLSSKGGKKGRK